MSTSFVASSVLVMLLGFKTKKTKVISEMGMTSVLPVAVSLLHLINLQLSQVSVLNAN